MQSWWVVMDLIRRKERWWVKGGEGQAVAGVTWMRADRYSYI